MVRYGMEEVLGRQRAKPSKIKARYRRPTCNNCSYLWYGMECIRHSALMTMINHHIYLVRGATELVEPDNEERLDKEYG